MHKNHYSKNNHSVTNREAVTPFRLCTKMQIYKSKGIHYNGFPFCSLTNKERHFLQEEIIICVKKYLAVYLK